MLNYKLVQPATWLLPFLLAAFLLCTSPSWTSIFNETTRWGFLLLGLVWALLRRHLWLIFRSRIGYVTAFLLLWPIATVAWSEMPSLSLIKSLGFLATTCTMFALGMMWAWMRPTQRIMHVFLPFFAVFILLIVVSGMPTGLATGYSDLYEGAGNPNFVGIASTICLPLVLWHLFKPSTSWRWLWWAAAGFLAYMELSVLSRSSLMASGVIIVACLIGIGAKRIAVWSGVSLIMLMTLLLFSPNLSSAVNNYIYESIIMKGALSIEGLDKNAFASRTLPFEEQLRAAEAGGILGGGYGVQLEVGHYEVINDFFIQSSPGSYKREKASTALAILEEQGWLGLIITAVWLWSFFWFVIRQYRAAPQGTERLQMGIYIALLIGLVLVSMFEAWWVSPGSLESLVFWAVAGLTYGLGRRYETDPENLSNGYKRVPCR